MRAAVTERNTKSLGRSDRNVCPQLTRRHQESQTQKIGRDNSERPVLMKPIDKGPVIVDRAIGRGILEQCSENRLFKSPVLMIPNDNFNPERFRSGFDNSDCLRMTSF